MATATIVGAGFMGSAMAWPLIDNGFEVNLVGSVLDDDIIKACLESGKHPKLKRTLPEGITPVYWKECDEAIRSADLIVCGVSSPGIDWAAAELGKRIQAHQLVVGITKGLRIEDDEISLFPDLLRRAFPADLQETIFPAAIGGPCIAGELAAKRPTCVILSSHDAVTAEKIAGMLRTPYYNIFTSKDLLGLEIGVALKNAYCLGVGMAYGMHTADEAEMNIHNTAAAVFAQGTHEIAKILAITNTTVGFASGLPGAGDLFVTTAGGRTMKLGRLLGEGVAYQEALKILSEITLESVQIVTEMSKILPVWEREGKITKESLPLMRTLIAAVVEEQPVVFHYEHFFKDVI